MDEIELLRCFRADLPSPSARQVETARAALMKAIADEGGRQSAAAGRPPIRWHRPWAAAVGAGLAALAIATVLLVAFSSSPTGTPSAAAQALRHAAAVAAGGPTYPPPRANQFFYTSWQGGSLQTFAAPSASCSQTDTGANCSHNQQAGWSALAPVTREVWISPDGPGRIREVSGRPRFLSASDRARWQAAGRPRIGGSALCERSVCNLSIPQGLAGWHGFYRHYDVSRLPTNETKLRQEIEGRTVENAPPGDAGTFTIIRDLLSGTYAPPKLRAALYRIAAKLPGVQLVGTVRDEAGRKGTAVAYVDRGKRQELIFDRKTAALLGERDVLVDPAAAGIDAPIGTIVGDTSYLSAGVVDSTSMRPHSGSRSGR